ncbi:saccharopine dehydrogenase NADP-binding domain-containing protein [Amycolatopsis sp. NPDC059027]|uniref:saccharopine dehydrogenase NADP-binding domain-containing protein n=1 Tax=unclassified Amycolatopsis TaxID=2618356 RepID=UPI003672DC6D
MTGPPLIGVVGGYGAVGATASRRILRSAAARVRIGGRNLTAARELVTTEPATSGPPAEAMAVDFTDGDSLARFCAGCRVVLNCAGPSYRIADRVARAAFAAGADYVDVGGYDATHKLLAGTAPGRTAVLSAGVLPGLSGLLPRWLAGQYPGRPRRLLCYMGGLDHFPPAGAADFLASLHNGFGESLAMWRGGARASRALSPLPDAELPLFPEPVTALPYLSTEAERLGAALGLAELSWYNVYPGRQTLATLNRAHWQGAGESAAMVLDLSRSAEVDLVGSEPYLVLLAQLDGELDGRPATRSLLLRVREPYRLNGTIAARTALAVLGGEIGAGVHHADEALAPQAAYDELRASGVVDVLTVLDTPLGTADVVEEGAL